MRSHHALYIAAIAFFALTGAIMAFAPLVRWFPWVIVTAVLGGLSLALGYSRRPKPQPTAGISSSTAAEMTEGTPKGIAQPLTELTYVKGIGEKRAMLLKGAGIAGIRDLANASAEDLAAKINVSTKLVARWIEDAKRIIESGT